jgi:thiamine pyrophosphokinase
MHTTVVFAGGPSPDLASLSRTRRRLDDLDFDRSVAADGGLHLAQDLGVDVGLVVGDLDSVDASRLDRAVDAGARVERHPEDKDATDLELALDSVLATDADRAVVVGSPDGRMDHLLATMTALAAPRLASLQPEAWLGDDTVVAVHARRELHGRAGAVVSLVPVHGAAVGVSTTGLRWRLDGETLHAGTSRGVSNRFTDDVATVRVDEGSLLAVIPGADS